MSVCDTRSIKAGVAVGHTLATPPFGRRPRQPGPPRVWWRVQLLTPPQFADCLVNDREGICHDRWSLRTVRSATIEINDQQLTLEPKIPKTPRRCSARSGSPSPVG